MKHLSKDVVSIDFYSQYSPLSIRIINNISHYKKQNFFRKSEYIKKKKEIKVANYMQIMYTFSWRFDKK